MQSGVVCAVIRTFKAALYAARLLSLQWACPSHLLISRPLTLSMYGSRASVTCASWCASYALTIWHRRCNNPMP